MSIGLVVLFYVFCVSLGIAGHWFYNLLNRPCFRDDCGETTEAGYEEDGIGRPYEDPSGQFQNREIPHVETIGGSDMGPL